MTYLKRESATDEERWLGQQLVGGVAALCSTALSTRAGPCTSQAGPHTSSTALSTISLFRPPARVEGCGSDAADGLEKGKGKRFGVDIAKTRQRSYG